MSEAKRELKREVVVVPDWPGSRDSGKVFLIEEWDSYRAEKWGWRLLLAINRGGGQIPENIVALGMEGIALVGFNTLLRGFVQWTDIEPLLDEQMTAIKIVRDPARPDIAQPLMVDGVQVSKTDIMDVKTRLWLRSEWVRVHANFSPADAVSTLVAAAAKISAASSSTRTSRRRSASPSQADTPALQS